MRNLSNIPATISKRLMISLTLVVVSSVIVAALLYEPANAADPAPVNPPGPLPAVLADSAGNNYEVFTPEEGGIFVGEEFSFVAVPGDVPSAVIVGVRMSKGAEASNVGMTHHRYTVSGNYYLVDAVDANGTTPSPAFRFRNPAIACVPIPPPYFANIDSLALIATDARGSTQTVLNSETRIGDDGLKLCAYVGTVPTILAVGLEGAPAPIPPTPAVVETIVELPVTGGSAPDRIGLAIFLGLGVVALVIGYSISLTARRRNDLN